jgi:hypothetical protein
VALGSGTLRRNLHMVALARDSHGSQVSRQRHHRIGQSDRAQFVITFASLSCPAKRDCSRKAACRERWCRESPGSQVSSGRQRLAPGPEPSPSPVDGATVWSTQTRHRPAPPQVWERHQAPATSENRMCGSAVGKRCET